MVNTVQEKVFRSHIQTQMVCSHCVCVQTIRSEEKYTRCRYRKILSCLRVLCEPHGKLVNQIDGDTIIALGLVANECLSSIHYRCSLHRRMVLHWATCQGSPELTYKLFQMLLTDEHIVARIDEKNIFGDTALYRLLRKGTCNTTVKLLISFGAELPSMSAIKYLNDIIWCKNMRMYMPFWKHVVKQYLSEIREGDNNNDINTADVEGNTLLHILMSAFGTSVTATQYLLQLGADPTAPNNTGKTPMHILCSVPCSQMLKTKKQSESYSGVNGSSSEEPRKQVLTLLLFHDRKNSPIHIVDNLGRSVLHYAAEDPRRVSLVPMLIAHGADITKRDKEGNTPLHLACPDASWKHILNPFDHATAVALHTQNKRGQCVLYYHAKKYFGLAPDTRCMFIRFLANLGATPTNNSFQYASASPAESIYNYVFRTFERLSALTSWQPRNFPLYPRRWRRGIQTLLCICKLDIHKRVGSASGYTVVPLYPESGIFMLPIELRFYVFEFMCCEPFLGIM